MSAAMACTEFQNPDNQELRNQIISMFFKVLYLFISSAQLFKALLFIYRSTGTHLQSQRGSGSSKDRLGPGDHPTQAC